MNEAGVDIKNPPIVEAVLDIECDLPPGQAIETLEQSAREQFQPQYPRLQTQFLDAHKIEVTDRGISSQSMRHGVQAYQFHQADGKQLIQVRAKGFSFNRLAPYSALDDYLPEIERTWNLYVKVASPIGIRLIRLRYINRILLPRKDTSINLERYFRIGPSIPDQESDILTGFLIQQSLTEKKTGNQINTVLTAQSPEGETLPIIFDNCVLSPHTGSVADWPSILAKILELRDLKNHIFRRTLTDECLLLFR